MAHNCGDKWKHAWGHRVAMPTPAPTHSGATGETCHRTCVRRLGVQRPNTKATSRRSSREGGWGTITPVAPWGRDAAKPQHGPRNCGCTQQAVQTKSLKGGLGRAPEHRKGKGQNTTHTFPAQRREPPHMNTQCAGTNDNPERPTQPSNEPPHGRQSPTARRQARPGIARGREPRHGKGGVAGTISWFDAGDASSPAAEPMDIASRRRRAYA